MTVRFKSLTGSPEAALSQTEARAVSLTESPKFMAPGGRCAEQLSDRELFFLVATSALLFIGTMSVLGSWRYLVHNYGDNQAYSDVATAIQHWSLRNLDVQHFMGYSYCIAAISFLLHIPVPIGLWLVAFLSSLTAVFLTARLFGNWTAAYFALTNFAWLQISFLGGAEPLGLALGLGAFWMFRRRKVFTAALMGALAVTVRPLMIFVLIGIGCVLLYGKQFRACFIALGTGLVIGFFYVLPLAISLGDPLHNLRSYTSRDYGAANVVGPHGHLFGWPFHGIVVGTMTYPAPWTSLVLSFFWIALVLTGITMIFSARCRDYIRTYPAEVIYCGLYLLAVFCYDYIIWARSNFIRFVIPALPFVFYALLGWLPKNRALVWMVGTVSSVLAAGSAIGIRNVVKF